LTLARPVVVKPNYHQNFLVLVDLSRSMSVEDYLLDGQPASRLKMTQTALKNLLEELPAEARLGVVTFVGYIYRPNDINLIRTLPQVVGSSREELKQLIDWISWSQTSSSGSPVQLAVSHLIGYVRSHQELLGDNLTIILITDGEENVGVQPIAPDYFFRWNNEQHTRPASQETSSKIYISEELFEGLNLKFVVAGIGTSSGGPIPKFNENWNFAGYERDYSGQLQVSRRDNVFLMELAQNLGAEYLKIDGPDDLKVLAGDQKYKTAVSQVQKDLSTYTILAALVFFLAALVL
jgi:hypothetical protein